MACCLDTLSARPAPGAAEHRRTPAQNRWEQDAFEPCIRVRALHSRAGGQFLIHRRSRSHDTHPACALIRTPATPLPRHSQTPAVPSLSQHRETPQRLPAPPQQPPVRDSSPTRGRHSRTKPTTLATPCARAPLTPHTGAACRPLVSVGWSPQPAHPARLWCVRHRGTRFSCMPAPTKLRPRTLPLGDAPPAAGGLVWAAGDSGRSDVLHHSKGFKAGGTVTSSPAGPS